jgi:hypothetical protein
MYMRPSRKKTGTTVVLVAIVLPPPSCHDGPGPNGHASIFVEVTEEGQKES